MEFVNFEIAEKLKDLGYSTPFFFFYRTDTKLIHHAMVSSPLTYGKNVDDEAVIAPTISQVLKWLRKEKEIMVEIPITLMDNGIWKFTFLIQTKELYDRSNHEYDTYEYAALAGIEYVLNNLI